MPNKIFMTLNQPVKRTLNFSQKPRTLKTPYTRTFINPVVQIRRNGNRNMMNMMNLESFRNAKSCSSCGGK